eukprot:5272018-Pleurochrysis_carterae.AAC.1
MSGDLHAHSSVGLLPHNYERRSKRTIMKGGPPERAQACVEPPDATYTPSLPRALLAGERGMPNPRQNWDRHAEGALSAAQLEVRHAPPMLC